jgi:cob(I)alamin adenosyltransferase
MKIYTKKGDKGTTSLLGGTRVSKSHIRIESYGTVDELNSWIGLLRDMDDNDDRREFMKGIQDRLFTIGSSLAADPAKQSVKIPDLHDSDITVLEDAMDKMNEVLPEMRHFVLPGGHRANSTCHIARCVCRRCERAVIRLAEEEPVDERVISYLNRLSDYLFVLCRTISFETGSDEVPWLPRK